MTRSLILLASLLSLTAATHAAPVNDSITSATKLKAPITTLAAQNLSLAKVDPMDPLVAGASAGKSLWYAIPTPVISSYVAVSIKSTTATGVASIYYVQDIDNPKGSLYPSGQSGALTPGSTLNLKISALGQAAVIMVAGEGVFDITYRCSDAAVPNDFPATAKVLAGDKGTVIGTTAGATITADEPNVPSFSYSAYNTVWYRWTPSFSDTAYVDTNFSFPTADPDTTPLSAIIHDTIIAVYQSAGGSPDALTLIAGDDDSGWDYNSRVGFTASAGTTYYIAVATTGSYIVPGAFNLQYYRGNTAGEIYTDLLNVRVMENGGTAYVPVHRRYAGNNTASLTMASLAGGSATAGADFTAFNKTVNFTNPSSVENSDWEAIVDVDIKDDAATENTESINFSFTAPSAGLTLTVNGGTVHIYDDESGSEGNGTLSLPENRFVVPESNMEYEVAVHCQGGAAERLHLISAVTGGNAQNLNDLVMPNDAWLDTGDSFGSTSFKVIGDNIFEPDETFTISIGNWLAYTVTIQDDDTYIPVQGSLVASLDYSRSARQAVLQATIARTGAITGKLAIQGQTLSFNGKLDLRGKCSVILAPKNHASFCLNISANDAYGAFKCELVDAATSRSSITIAQVQAFSALNPCPLAGITTFQGGSYGNIFMLSAGSLKVSATGAVTLTGRIFDGTAFTASGWIDGAGRVNVMAPLYGGTGCAGLSGSLPASFNEFSAVQFKLNRPAREGDPLKIGTIQYTFGCNACRYTPPAAGQRALEAWQGGTGVASLTGGGLMNTLTKNIAISTANIISTPVDALKLKITLVPATGLFSGSFVPPGTTTVRTFAGALIDLAGASGYGRGFFFDGLKGGTITIAKP